PTALPSLSDLSGAREATLMNRIARGFTPDESRAIALWLAAKK
ncbi:MAG: hypothetical protein RJB09_316, partial [Pseudomonadota bacterium]